MTYRKHLRHTIIILCCTALSGCTIKNPADPLEGYNRVMYKVNKGVDKAFIKPFAHIYANALPKPIRTGVHNFFQNLRTIPTVLNDLLQADFKCASNDMARLIINTTLGIGGILDVAATAGLEPRYVDFGLTLAHWGYRESTYLVLPFFGPSTIRDGVGLGVTYYMSVWPYITRIRSHHHKAVGLRNGLFILNIIDTRAGLLDTESIIDTAAVDEYIFIRDAYLQNRKYEIEGIKPAPTTGPNPMGNELQGPPE